MGIDCDLSSPRDQSQPWDGHSVPSHEQEERRADHSPEDYEDQSDVESLPDTVNEDEFLDSSAMYNEAYSDYEG